MINKSSCSHAEKAGRHSSQCPDETIGGQKHSGMRISFRGNKWGGIGLIIAIASALICVMILRIRHQAVPMPEAPVASAVVGAIVGVVGFVTN